MYIWPLPDLTSCVMREPLKYLVSARLTQKLGRGGAFIIYIILYSIILREAPCAELPIGGKAGGQLWTGYTEILIGSKAGGVLLLRRIRCKAHRGPYR